MGYLSECESTLHATNIDRIGSSVRTCRTVLRRLKALLVNRRVSESELTSKQDLLSPIPFQISYLHVVEVTRYARSLVALHTNRMSLALERRSNDNNLSTTLSHPPGNINNSLPAALHSHAGQPKERHVGGEDHVAKSGWRRFGPPRHRTEVNLLLTN